MLEVEVGERNAITLGFPHKMDTPELTLCYLS